MHGERSTWDALEPVSHLAQQVWKHTSKIPLPPSIYIADYFALASAVKLAEG